ncbi:carbohydrate sulfotransferase 11-like [Oratosquilla oratoria]|uniref:carbohydrate sulfotransferase 11-like n=1 Tax=Oratosquilla oratoria TaxID=337810 RepID=UPI003F76091F
MTLAKDWDFVSSRLDIYKERARQVSSTCRKHKNIMVPVNTEMVWDVQHQPNLIWCLQAKIASTSWRMNYLRLAHWKENDTEILQLPPEKREKARFKNEHPGYRGRIVHQLFPPPATIQEKTQVFRDGLRVMIVRHPFTRILSAYRDKIASDDPRPPMFNFKQLQKNIIKKYRKPKSKNKSRFPTFSEFVQYVIDSTSKLKTVPEWRKVICWTPMWAYCAVCSNDIQLILKLETMEEDERFIITLAQLNELKDVHEWMHLANGTSSTNAAFDFYKSLTKQQMKQLHHAYKLDFDLFGYEIDEYLAIARNAKKET